MKRRWMITLLLLPVAVLVTALATYRIHTVPTSQCSELYRQYRHLEGVKASYIKDFPVNDTLRLDVTLLQAADSAAWERLKEDFGIVQWPDNVVALLRCNEDIVQISIAASDYKEHYKGLDIKEIDIIAGAFRKQTISVFHLETTEQQHAVIQYNLLKNIKQKDYEQNN